MRLYWASAPADDLSQGDLLQDVWVGTQPSPRVSLFRGLTAKGGGGVWNESAAWGAGKDGFGHYLGRGKQAFAIVISHSCEIDKREGKGPVLVAPVVALRSAIADESKQDVVRRGDRFAFFPLPALPGIIEESYVDLRAISYVPRAVLDSVHRHASASEEGVQDIATHLIGFLTRIPMSEIRK